MDREEELVRTPWQIAASEAGCYCAAHRKPCSYHEGYQDGWDDAREALSYQATHNGLSEETPMSVVWKYELPIDDVVKIELPMGAKFFHAGLDPNGQPCMWLNVTPDQPTMVYTFYIVGTGNPVPDEVGPHLASFIDGSFVWHLFGMRAP